MGATRKPFVSQAQNFEDVVLWRALQDVDQGCYVDVGACDPVADSISWPFYEQGWRGALIEPVPSWADALRRRRPDDVTIEAAAGAAAGTAPLFASTTTGNSTLVRDVADRIRATGIAFSAMTTRVAPLDDLLEEAGFRDRTIHFCTIDVEGSEADVLAGFDLARWRPWILVIEATEPNRPQHSHPDWEGRLLDEGYRFCLFDGLNRFYVHPGKADDLGERLSYPACVFDEPFSRAVKNAHRSETLEQFASQASRRADTLEQIASRVARVESENATLVARLARVEREKEILLIRADEAAAQLSRMEATVSWRVTRPLRAVRAKQIRLGRAPRTTSGERERSRAARKRLGVSWTPARHDRGALELAFAHRAMQAAELLLPGGRPFPGGDVNEALAILQEALTSSEAPDRAKAWLALVAVDGTYPGERSVERIARMSRMNGPGVRKELLTRFTQSVEAGHATTGELEVRCNRVVVDVTHTARANDLHTGIQRVVRETVARWIDARRPMDLIRFDLEPPAARLLSEEACTRLRSWRAVVGSVTTSPHTAAPQVASAKTLVPWQCDLVVPELPFEPQRTAAYRGLGSASVLRSLSMVGYDVIPIVAAEKVVTEVADDFVGYLSVLKHADRVSAISQTSRQSFEAFATMAAAEGLPPPVVQAHELPTEAVELDSWRLDAVRSELGIGERPVVLVVGSHEPRKNHLAVLEAAERLWAARGNSAFQLLFLGWSGWLNGEFEELVADLAAAGRPVFVRKRCTEDELWAAYRLARFSVFPSLLEGFGLPIAESLASGTPVITSDYGSMAEVAEKGGCVLVDPRDIDALERAIANLLDDDDALEKLRDEALTADTGTWERYAGELWDFLTRTAVQERLENVI